MKKKKVAKKKKPTKQKIDVVLESLLNLERRMKELISKIEKLEQQKSLPYYPPQPHYWPNIPRYDSVTWNDGCQKKVSQ